MNQKEREIYITAYAEGLSHGRFGAMSMKEDADGCLGCAFEYVEECEEQTNMKKSCENCKYLFEGKNGEHCKNCIHNAKDNFEPVQNKKRSD